VDLVTQNHEKVLYDVLTDSRETVEDNSGHSDTEPTDDILRGSDKLVINYRRQQWTYCQKTNSGDL